MAPSVVNSKDKKVAQFQKIKNFIKLKIKLKNIKNLSKKISIMLEIILLRKQDHCIIIVKKNQKVFMVKQLLMKFLELKDEGIETDIECHGLKIMIIKFF